LVKDTGEIILVSGKKLSGIHRFCMVRPLQRRGRACSEKKAFRLGGGGFGCWVWRKRGGTLPLRATTNEKKQKLRQQKEKSPPVEDIHGQKLSGG